MAIQTMTKAEVFQALKASVSGLFEDLQAGEFSKTTESMGRAADLMAIHEFAKSQQSDTIAFFDGVGAYLESEESTEGLVSSFVLFQKSVESGTADQIVKAANALAAELVKEEASLESEVSESSEEVEEVEETEETEEEVTEEVEETEKSDEEETVEEVDLFSQNVHTSRISERIREQKSQKRQNDRASRHAAALAKSAEYVEDTFSWDNVKGGELVK